jgi:hypothetical protein
MVRIAVEVEQGVTGTVSDGGHPVGVPTLTDIDDALEEHDGDRRGGSDPHRGVGEATASEDPSTLALRLATPHAVIDPFIQRILEAGVSHRALGTDPLGGLHADTVARKENGGVEIPALALAHPIGSHDCSLGSVVATEGVPRWTAAVVIRSTASVAFHLWIRCEMSRC